MFMRKKVVFPATKNGIRPVHPSEVLREDYLKPLDMSANALRASAWRINDITLERRSVTVNTAMRASRRYNLTLEIKQSLLLKASQLL
jgi:plasmid maintenance system antidote protein VapI